EDFQARNRQMLRGGHSLSFDEALELMREIERLGKLARNLLEGRFDEISMDELRELAGEEGVESIMILRDMRRNLEEGGFIRPGEAGLELTPRAIRRIGELALEDIYGSLKKGSPGAHATTHRGGGAITIERSKPYVFGEPAYLDAVTTVKNALLRDPKST